MPTAGAYDPRVLDALARCHDVLASEDILLISRGTVVTEPLILRLENYANQGRVGRLIRIRD